MRSSRANGNENSRKPSKVEVRNSKIDGVTYFAEEQAKSNEIEVELPLEGTLKPSNRSQPAPGSHRELVRLKGKAS